MEVQQALSLLVLSLSAFIIPLLSERIHVPAAVGEIIFGILLSHNVFHILEPSDFLTFLARFGFVYLMFLVGLEIDFSAIARMGRRNVMISLVAVVLVFVMGLAVAYGGGRPLFMALVLSCMSLGLVLVALRDISQTASPFGQAVLLLGSIGEFLSIVLLTVYDLGSQHGPGLDMLWGLIRLGLILVLAYFVLLILRTLVWWFPDQFARVVATHDTSEIGVRASFALMLAFMALASLFQVEAILGTFVAGALFSSVFREKKAIETKLSSFGFGFFVPIFFINVGMTFDLQAVMEHDFMAELGFLFLGSLTAKMLPLLLLLWASFRFRDMVSAGVILSAPLTLLVAMAEIGLHIHAIDKQIADTIILYAILGGIVYPVLFRLLAPRERKASA